MNKCFMDIQKSKTKMRLRSITHSKLLWVKKGLLVPFGLHGLCRVLLSKTDGFSSRQRLCRAPTVCHPSNLPQHVGPQPQEAPSLDTGRSQAETQAGCPSCSRYIIQSNSWLACNSKLIRLREGSRQRLYTQSSSPQSRGYPTDFHAARGESPLCDLVWYLEH